MASAKDAAGTKIALKVFVPHMISGRFINSLIVNMKN